MKKIKEYIDHNIKLYKLYKEKIKEGWWGWHAGTCSRFKCVCCGEILKANNSLISYIEVDGIRACENLTCWDCYQPLKKMRKNE